MTAQDHLQPAQFLRVGDWDKSETSGNYAEGRREPGVSVYELHPPDSPYAGAPKLPSGPDADDMNVEEDFNSRMRSDEPKHLVTGKVLPVRGHDGEPLLKNVKRVGEWKPPDWATHHDKLE